MKKILFLPFLQMPTGHHQVVDALIRSLKKRIPEVNFKKIDFLSYVNKRLEKIITFTYSKWIYNYPRTYHWAYHYFVYPSNSTKHLQWYESLFKKKMLEMLSKEKPDLIVCTQAYPSYLISRLKELGEINTPVINVYTDFFINKVWGCKGIDYHFVPDTPFKHELMSFQKISEDQIFITGIPVDECFIPKNKQHKIYPPYNIIISGGNSGFGDIFSILQRIKYSSKLRYIILCGNNENLFFKIKSLKKEHIKPLSYISSREEMDKLYNQADAIITKPGGVTISEAFIKKLPIFIHSVLPGQEEINRNYLLSQGLAYTLNLGHPFEEQLLNVLNNQSKQNYWHEQVETYQQRLETIGWKKLLELTKKEGLS